MLGQLLLAAAAKSLANWRSLNSSSSCVGSRLSVLPREQGAEEHHQIPAGKVVQRAGALLRPLYLYHATGAGQNPR